MGDDKPTQAPPGNQGHKPSTPLKKLKWWLKGFNEPITVVTLLLFGATVALYCATRDLVRDAQHTAERQLRAYIGIDSKTVALKCGGCVPTVLPRDAKGFYDDDFIAIGIHNFGQTQALELSTRSNWMEMPFGAELPKDFKYPDTPLDEVAYPMSKSTLNPGDSALSGNQFGADIVAIINRGRKHQGSMYLYGHIDYRDVFGKARQSPFCFRYAPDVEEAHRFPLCPEHNSPTQDD